MWEIISDFLHSLSNGPLRYTYIDIGRTITALVLAAIIWQQDSDALTRKIAFGLYVLAVPLIIHDLLHSELNILSLSMGVNVLFATLVGKLLYQKYLISKSELHLFVSFAVFIPTYPLATAFPLSRSPLMWPLQSFTLTILLYIGLITGAIFAKNAITNYNRDIESPSIIATLLGRPIPASEVSNQTARLLDGTRPVLFGPSLSTLDIQEYLLWHNETQDTPVESIKELESPDFEQFLCEVVGDGELPVDSSLVENYASQFSDSVGQEHVWVSSLPSFTRVMMTSLVLSLIFGSPVPV